jgi:hypothetical protein
MSHRLGTCFEAAVSFMATTSWPTSSARKSSLILVKDSLRDRLAAATLRGVGLAPAEGYST